MNQFSQLTDRKLWFDGVSEVSPSALPKLIMLGVPLQKLAVTELSKDVIELNRINDIPLKTKAETSFPVPPEWSLPDSYKYLNLDEYLISLADRIEQDELYDRRLERLAQEIELFETMRLTEVLKALIFIVEEMTRQGVVWGVGRGSSCSSYLLYLIGLHEVDVVRFDIPITDFIHT